MSTNIRLINRENIYKGDCFELVSDQVIWTNGKRVNQSLIIHSGISVMLPVLAPDLIILIKQYRYGSNDSIWELPAGTIIPGETPLQCAKREIEEEIGYKAENWKKLISCYTSPHHSTEKVHCFIGANLVKTQINPDENEIITAKIFPVNKVKEFISNGKIQDAKTLVALLYYFNLDN